MIFKPIPYKETVDDLLTGITGGHFREPHLFRPGIRQYALVHVLDVARLEFVKIVGTLNGELHVFVLNQEILYLEYLNIYFFHQTYSIHPTDLLYF